MSETCAASPCLASGIACPTVSHCVLCAMPSAVSSPESLMHGNPVHHHAGGVAARIEDGLGADARQQGHRVGVQVREELLPAHHPRRGGCHRAEAEQAVEPVGRHLLARNGLQIGLRRLESRPRAVGEFHPERQRRATVVEPHARDGLAAASDGGARRPRMPRKVPAESCAMVGSGTAPGSRFAGMARAPVTACAARPRTLGQGEAHHAVGGEPGAGHEQQQHQAFGSEVAPHPHGGILSPGPGVSYSAAAAASVAASWLRAHAADEDAPDLAVAPDDDQVGNRVHAVPRARPLVVATTG